MGKEKEDKKGINLMPEDLRTKESSILSKVKSKTEFDFDFVSPKNSSLKKIEKKKGISLIDRIKKIFNKPKSFGESNIKPKIEDLKHTLDKNKKVQEIEKAPEKPARLDMHIPNKLSKKDKDYLKIDYKSSILEEEKIEDKINIKVAASIFDAKDKEEKKVKNKAKGSSFWAKLKKIFTIKAKVPKPPKVNKVPAKAIVTKDIKEIIAKKVGPVKVVDNKVMKLIPQLPGKDKEEKKVKVLDTESLDKKSELNNKIEKKDTAFSIPSAPIKKVPEKKEHIESFKLSKTKKEELPLQKFHKPQARIRAKLLEDGGGVDLIPDSAKTRSWRQIVNLLLVASLGSIFIIGIFYSFLFYQSKNIEVQKANRTEQVTSLEKQIIEYNNLNDDITFLGNEIKTIHKLLGFHFYWTNFFQLLEKYTIAEVYYSDIAVGNGGALTLHATANSFEDLARQIKVLEQEEAHEFVKSVDVSSARYNKITGVEFDITMVLNPSLFTYNEDYLYKMNNDDEE